MSMNHRNQVTRLMDSSKWNNIVLFLDYCFEREGELSDPHYCTEFIYRNCFELIETGCDRIIERIEHDHF